MQAIQKNMEAQQIRIQGVVQGVGFRPFVYRLAQESGISGWVRNRNDGVLIHAQGTSGAVSHFLRHLKTSLPAVCRLDEMNCLKVLPVATSDFAILPSQDISGAYTGVSPDLACCDDCLRDISQQAHRKNYPLVNCTHCGPRFTIIESLPYDRPATTMQRFSMCETCRSEYEDPLNRRFHAQPIACLQCGPSYSLESGGVLITEINPILHFLARVIREGGLVALKGTGGYNLLCHAGSEEAVLRARTIKGREQKPFAIMFKDTDHIAEFCRISDDTLKLLEGWQRPIVLLEQKVPLAQAVNPGLQNLGAMLPNMAFHHLLFDQLGNLPIVFTSANRTGDPMIADDIQAAALLGSKVDAIAWHNRPILQPIDDSVCQVTAAGLQIIRRARGYVPDAITLPFEVEGILACGGDMKSAFALGRARQAILSPDFGDLENQEVCQRYRESLRHFKNLFRFDCHTIAVDQHPAYQARSLGMWMAKESGKKLVEVQHHHAHLASVMAEYGLMGQVIGVCFDGTGYGADGHTWGSEFMLCDFETYVRKAHFAYLPLPGGDQAVRQPWRMALAMLMQSLGPDWQACDAPFLRDIEKDKVEAVAYMIRNELNCPLSCGAGRLFDVVAAMLGICTHPTYDGEGPIKLQALCGENQDGAYDFGQGPVVDTYPVIAHIYNDILQGVAHSVIASRFHIAMAKLIARQVIAMHRETGLTRVVLSGGVFQNGLLLKQSLSLIQKSGLQVFTNHKVPVNDGGLALGQLAIAAGKGGKKCV
jgi:hydrogenase maturation protein HypF